MLESNNKDIKQVKIFSFFSPRILCYTNMNNSNQEPNPNNGFPE